MRFKKKNPKTNKKNTPSCSSKVRCTIQHLTIDFIFYTKFMKKITQFHEFFRTKLYKLDEILSLTPS